MGQGSDPLTTANYKTAAHQQYDQDADADVQQIEEEIEETRAEMSDTINAIQERLSPQNLADQAREAVYDATVGRAKGFGSNMLDTIKENPLPAAIAALSLGWLVRKSNERSYDYDYDYDYDRYSYGARDVDYYGRPLSYDDRQYRYSYYSDEYDQGGSEGMRERASHAVDNARHQAQDAADNVRHQAQDAMHNVRDQAQNMTSQAREQVGQTVDQVQEQWHEATEWAEDQYYSNPLMTGAVAVALGAAVGMMIPTARVENKVMGPTRDKVVNRVQHQAENVLNKVENVAEEATSAAKDAAKNTAKKEARNQGLTNS